LIASANHFLGLILTPERRRVVERIADEVRYIQRLMEKEETRMYSTSLLLIIEGDREALQRAKEMEKAPREDPTPEDTEAEYVLQDDDDEEEEEDEEVEFLTHNTSLIDFAHAAFTPNLGPDENTLRGIRNVSVILDSILRSP
jgi:1D-myo-inositol-tetrakisphosphate 5-kinase/inositol-polyphosphate multikinase